MDFSVSSLAASFVFSVFGIYVFREGKRRANIQLMLTGLAMMVYIYLTHGPWADWGVGLGLSALARYFWVNTD